LGFFRLFIFGALIYLLYRLVKGALGSAKIIDRRRTNGVIDEMVQDPSCKTYIPRRDAQKRSVAGREYFFCSKECADKFQEEMKR
jgi:YHS domain-containing protein